MRRRTTLRGVTALVGTVALATPIGYAATASATVPSGRHTLTNTVPRWAVPARVAGAPAASSQLTVDVQLPMRDAAGAAALARSVSDPTSPLYGRFLTTSQFNARFAPTAATVASVEDFLRSQGLTIKAVPSNRRYVEASGSVSQVQNTFATTVQLYNVNGQTLLAPSRSLSVPDALASQVLTVTGLGDVPMKPDHQRTEPANVTPGSKVPPPSTCSHYWDEHTQRVPKAYGKKSFPTYICGYTPQQFQSAYGLAHTLGLGHDGRGNKVAIIDAYASPTIEADANQLFTNTGTPTFKKGQFSQQVFKPFTRRRACGSAPGWWGEETLDVEAVHATAPGANQLYVGASNCASGLNQALNWVVSNVDKPHSKANGVSMVSNSYGNAGEQIPENAILATNQILIQASIEGIGVYFSSGDSGDESTLGHTDNPQPDFPASSPYATAVGGTSLAVASDGSYGFETGWGTDLDRVNVDGQGNEDGYQEDLPGDFIFGAGGGTSTLFNQPWYQRKTVPDSLATSFDGTRNRVVPDVAMDGDPYTGMLEGQTVDGTYTQYAIGGTSLACPLFVGLQATTQDNGKNIGFANPTLYNLQSQAFRDVRPPAHPTGVTNPSGSYLVTLDHDSSLATARGYDNVTGRGSPNGVSFMIAEFAAVNDN